MNQFNLKNGFTLLEALVAISILMVAVAAPITIAQKGLSSAIYSKDQMIASYLAQDALEYIKNKRDEVSKNNNFDWNNLVIFDKCLVDIINLDTGANSGCQINTTVEDVNSAISNYSATGFLKKDSNNFYQYGSGEETKFTRRIQIEINNGESQEGVNEALVAVTVNWTGVGRNEVTVETLMFNY